MGKEEKEKKSWSPQVASKKNIFDVIRERKEKAKNKKNLMNMYEEKNALKK